MRSQIVADLSRQYEFNQVRWTWTENLESGLTTVRPGSIPIYYRGWERREINTGIVSKEL